MMWKYTISFKHTVACQSGGARSEHNQPVLDTNKSHVFGPSPLKNFPSFFWAPSVFKSRLPAFPFRVDVDDLAGVNPRVFTLRDCGSLSGSLVFDARGGSIAAAKTDGMRGA